MICSRKKSAWCIQTIPHSLSVREFRPWKPKQLLKRRDKLMNAVSVKGLICKPKLHERTAYIRLKRSEKLIVYNVPAINIQCWFSVIWLLNDELKIDADKTRFPNPFPSKWVLRALIAFTLSNARRFYSSVGNLSDRKGLITLRGRYHLCRKQVHTDFSCSQINVKYWTDKLCGL